MAQEIETTKSPTATNWVDRYEQAKEALKRLDELVETLPPCDAVALVREGREDLEKRSAIDGD